MSGLTPTLAEAIRLGVERGLSQMYFPMPGRVVRWQPQVEANNEAARVDVELLVTDEDGAQYPVIPNVPVAWFQVGNFTVYFPLEVGDPVCVWFAGRSIDAWKQLGGVQDPDDLRRCALADAIAYPGVNPLTAIINGLSVDRMEIGHHGATKYVLSIGTTGIKIGSATVDFLDVVRDLIAGLKTATVQTALGPQPLDPATQATLANLKSSLESIMG